MDISSLSHVVLEHRRLSGLTQVELAKLAGVGKTVVFDLEHGKDSIRLDTLLKILRILNITVRLESPILARQENRAVEPSGEKAP
ncbi:MAG: helix-turn-helix domain-containing protein [Chthoniobacterales bacterium]